MLSMSEAYETAESLLNESPDESGTIIAFHNVALISEIVYKLSTSKKSSHTALGAALRVSLENYFTNR